MSSTCPQLVFFRNYPENWLDKPPLASALQSFETSLMLLALCRYPNALTSCGTALESLAKSILAIPPGTKRIYLKELTERLCTHCPSALRLKTFPEADLSSFIEKRNHLVHYGHAPEDDEECARLLLEVGYPLFEAMLADGSNFYLTRDKDAKDWGLLPDFSEQWLNTFHIWREIKDFPTLKPSLSFVGLIHSLRRSLQPNFTSVLESELIDSESYNFDSFDRIRSRVEVLENTFRDSWLMNCPYCDAIEAMVVGLDFSVEGTVSAKNARCASCDFTVPAVSQIVKILLLDSFTPLVSEICEAYGVSPVRGGNEDQTR